MEHVVDVDVAAAAVEGGGDDCAPWPMVVDVSSQKGEECD